MSRVDLKAFVAGPKTAERVQRLNQAVVDCAILPIVGPSGTGKDYFLHWWWQGGCSDAQFVGKPSLPSLYTNDIVLVAAKPAPSHAVPVACVVMSAIEMMLRQIQCARDSGEKLKPLGPIKKLRTDHELMSLVNTVILPLLDELDPRAIVVTNAHFLDWRTMPWLLELRRPVRLYNPSIAERALMLCATEDVTARSAGPFSKLMNREQGSEIAAAWPQKLVFQPMDPVMEFTNVMIKLIEHNLKATFGTDVEEDACIIEFGEWTRVNWHLIARLVEILDICLGAQPDNGPRVLSAKVMACVRQRWLKRQS